MHARRAWAAGVLTRNGYFLVTGGEDGKQTLVFAEVYEPWNMKWTLTGKMTAPRSRHTQPCFPMGGY